ncbi:MAG: GNAT family N-acetyltransferase [Anaerolineae bacterium]|jgi:ribosomal protein S18 acetylase RimI-like enzyme|nr:GNAT family N-acetyltransferase [Anaerolineae bacterium]
MSIVLRPAVAADVPGLAEVIRVALHDTPDPALIAANIALDDHAVLVAAAGDSIAGLAAGFTTLDTEGSLRWELDLLAVSPAYRRQGLGRRLIAACTAAGQAAGATQARALVAVGNVPSQRAFRHAGYALVPEMCGLYVSLPGDAPPALPAHAAPFLIPVTTLTYRGLWIEGDITPGGLHSACRVRDRYGWHSTGAVVPVSAAAAHAALRAAPFDLIGQFQWWARGL